MSNPPSSVGSTPSSPNDSNNGDQVQSRVQDGPASDGHDNTGLHLGDPNTNPSDPQPPEPHPDDRNPGAGAIVPRPPEPHPSDGDGTQLCLRDPNAGPSVPRPQGNPDPSLALQIVPQLPPPPPQQPPDLRQIVANYQHECAVCKSKFFNMRALSGHMRIHKNRGWRGLKPPPEASRPPAPSNIGFPYPKYNYHPGGYNPYLFNPYGVTVVGGTGASGLQNNSLALQWRPSQWYNYPMPTLGMSSRSTGGVGGSGGVGERRNEERDAMKDPGKQPALPEPPLTQRRSKRKRGSVPDLNLSPPREDQSEDDQGKGDGPTD